MVTHLMEVIRMGYKLHSTQEEKQMVQEYINGASVKNLMAKYGYKTKKSITDKVKKYQSIEAIEIARKNRKNYQIQFDGITNLFNAYLFTFIFLYIGRLYTVFPFIFVFFILLKKSLIIIFNLFINLSIIELPSI